MQVKHYYLYCIENQVYRKMNTKFNSLISIVVYSVCLNLSSYSLSYAQSDSVIQNDKYIIIMNSKREHVDRFNVGDSIMLKMENTKEVSGVIQSIERDQLRIYNDSIRYDEIIKIRKLKRRTLPIVIGGVLITSGIIIIAELSKGYTNYNKTGTYALGAIALIATGIFIIPPKYYRLNKSNTLIVISK